MRACRVAVTLGLVFVCFNNVVHADLVSFYADAVSTWSSKGAVISQDISQYLPVQLAITAQANSVFTITSTVTNDTDIVWTGYLLTLDPTGKATFAEGAAGSTKFGTVLYPDPWTIEFREPQSVLPGQVVTLQFDIDIPDGAPHTFTLTQNFIPEPATAALLGLGALALLIRRRR